MPKRPAPEVVDRITKSVATSNAAGSVLVKGFIQVDPLKGYRYLDDAGKIMVQYDDHFSEMQVGLEGLRMSGSDSPFDEAKVSANQIWCGFTRPPSLRCPRHSHAVRQ